jgi:hypothetical protein
VVSDQIKRLPPIFHKNLLKQLRQEWVMKWNWARAPSVQRIDKYFMSHKWTMIIEQYEPWMMRTDNPFLRPRNWWEELSEMKACRASEDRSLTLETWVSWVWVSWLLLLLLLTLSLLELVPVLVLVPVTSVQLVLGSRNSEDNIPVVEHTWLRVSRTAGARVLQYKRNKTTT